MTRTIHIVWVGPKDPPKGCIESWQELSGLPVRVWGNDDFKSQSWVTQPMMNVMRRSGQLNGVGNLMRYEILYTHGGIAMDADSICLEKLPDWLVNTCPAMAYENELSRPGFICAGYMNFPKGHPFLGDLIQQIMRGGVCDDITSWKTTGVVPIMAAIKKYLGEITVWPSHFFYPQHFTGQEYSGNGPVFAKQLWDSTHGN